MPRRLPHFDFYAWDWANDERVKLLSLEEQGAFLRVLIAMWQWSAKHETVDLPNDDRFLAAQVGVDLERWQRLRTALIDGDWAVLRVDDSTNTVYSKKMREVYVDAFRNAMVKRGNGEKGGRPRKNPLPAQLEEAIAEEEEPSDNLTDRYKEPTENLQVSVSETYSKPTENLADSHQSSVISHQSDQDQEIKTAATTARVREGKMAAEGPDPLLEKAANYVLPLFNRLQLKGTEGPLIQTALAQVNHDFDRFKAIVDEVAQRDPAKKIHHFGYFVEPFAEEAADRQARAAARQPPQGRDRASPRGRGASVADNNMALLRELYAEEQAQKGASP